MDALDFWPKGESQQELEWAGRSGFSPFRLAQLPGRSWRDRRIGLGLLAAALICRVAAACWWGDLLWADSVFYWQLSQALQRGDFSQVFQSLGLNVYPVILLWLDRLGTWLGLDWTVVGKCWSVLIATLAVLPFWGWARRLFPERIACWSSLFFAIHPHLVGYSPLIIRDPTYWFLFNLALYLSCRAVLEAKWWLFLGAGGALGLAMYTRTEGILLGAVMVGWALWQAAANPPARWRVLGGMILALAIVPLGVVVINLTWLREHPRWEWGRLPLLQRIWKWVHPTENILSSQSKDFPHLAIVLLQKDNNENNNSSPSKLPWLLSTCQRQSRPWRILSQKGNVSSSSHFFSLHLSFFPQHNQAKLLYSDLQLPPFLHFQQQRSENSATAIGLVGWSNCVYCSKPISEIHLALGRSLPSPSFLLPEAGSFGCWLSESAKIGEKKKNLSEWVQARRTALRLIKAIGYPYAFLIGLGLLRGWRFLLRPDQLALSLHNFLLFLATWAYLSSTGGLDSRYFCPILITALPYAAIGFLSLGNLLKKLVGQWPTLGTLQTNAVGASLGLFVLIALSIAEVQPSATRLMRQQTQLGQWILSHLGPGKKILCTKSAENLLAYHAQASSWSWPHQTPLLAPFLRKRFVTYQPDVVLLWEDPIYRDFRWLEEVAKLCEEFGYRPIRKEELPEGVRHVRVWVRPTSSLKIRKHTSSGNKIL